MATVAQFKHAQVLAILESTILTADQWDAANKILAIFGIPPQTY